jgi:uncharacterized protein YecT (DUF1311 family)
MPDRVLSAVLMALAAALAAPAPLAAQSKDEGALRFDGDLIQSCLDGGGWRDCIGIAAQSCMEATPGGASNVVMTGCLAREAEWWDTRLNAEYRALMARERASDSEWQPIPGLMPRPSGAEALRTAQRAWIAWRDATCTYEELQWWGGTGASGAALGCDLRLTAEQVLALMSYQAEG